VVEGLHGVLDLTLVGLDVDDEDKSLLVLDLLHGGLRGERILDDSKLVHLRQALFSREGMHSLSDILRLAYKLLGLGLVESHILAGLDRFLATVVAHYCLSHDYV